MTLQTTEILSNVAEELNISDDDLIRMGMQSYLERQLRAIQAEIFEVLSRYNVDGIEDMEERYRTSVLEEADSWQDLQRLDHLEYKRDQLQTLLLKIS